MVLKRTKAEILSGTEFLVGTQWMARPDLNRMQASWHCQVFGVRDASASWYRILVESGEPDRLTAKILVRAIMLANRLSCQCDTEATRQVFEEAWAAEDSQA